MYRLFDTEVEERWYRLEAPTCVGSSARLTVTEGGSGDKMGLAHRVHPAEATREKRGLRLPSSASRSSAPLLREVGAA